MNPCHSEDALLRLIYLTSLRLQIHADRMLQPFGLTLEQLHPLKILSHSGGAVSQRQMCAISGKTPANMTRILDRLVAKGLVERRPDPSDRRAFTVVLTHAGEELIAQVITLFSGYLDQVLDGITEEEEAACRRVLQRIARNLDGLVPDDLPKDEQG